MRSMVAQVNHFRRDNFQICATYCKDILSNIQASQILLAFTMQICYVIDKANVIFDIRYKFLFRESTSEIGIIN